MRRHLPSLLMAAGCLLALIPVLLGFLDGFRQFRTVAAYQQDVSALKEEQAKTLLEKARAWNLQRKAGQDPEDAYETILDPSGTGIMATLSIPKISVDLPVWHGTDEAVLSVGAGHLETSDLPVGGSGNRAVLSAHRGLPSARLFTRLDELKPGDLFFLQTGNENLAYEVTETETIRPEETDRLAPVAGEDLVSLVTCTPYGINTHRLVVTGRRIPYVKREAETILPAVPSGRELLMLALPLVPGAAAVWMYRKERA